jgi:hypothetical protein
LDVDVLDASDFTVKCLPSHIFEAIEQLTGKEGEVMERWGSLRLSLPPSEEGLAERVWQLFNFPSPRLTRLTVTVYGFINDYPDIEEMTGAFPDLSGLKHLDVETLYIFKSLALDHISIESLVLHQGVVAWPFFQLSKFTNLQTLVIHPGFDLSNPSDKFDVTLPALKEISFIGNVRHLRDVRFHIPVLQDIYFVGMSRRDINDTSYNFPEMQGLHVHWSEAILWNRSWKDEDLQQELRSLVSHFDQAKRFTVSGVARQALISTICLMHSGRILSPHLEKIVVQREGEAAEILDVQRLITTQR